jgi:3-isopropylmalate dehydratase small subunit
MADRHEFLGRVWSLPHKQADKGLDDIDTDQIIPAAYITSFDPAFLAQHAFKLVHPDFVPEARKWVSETGTSAILVEGHNFGKGSSREHAPRALKGLGVSCVVARSFARIFRTNSIYNGLPPVTLPDVRAETGDLVRVRYAEGEGGTVEVFRPEGPVGTPERFLGVRAEGATPGLRFREGGKERSVAFSLRGRWSFGPLEDPLLERILWTGGLAAYTKAQIVKTA